MSDEALLERFETVKRDLMPHVLRDEQWVYSLMRRVWDAANRDAGEEPKSVEGVFMAFAKQGYALSLVTDDEGSWAVTDQGVTTSSKDPDGKKYWDVTSYIERDWWKPTPSEALRAFLERNEALENSHE